ncbi:MAG: endolytic transglycosylase MltG [gamma proteobacterium symbiont of Phacoides pectinatus]
MMHRMIGGVILIASFGAAWLMMDFNRFKQTPLDLPEEGLSYTLEPGTSYDGVVEALRERGVLENPLYMRLLGRLDGRAGRIQAGEYDIPHGTTPETLIALLVSGRVKSYSLTVIEGWTFSQLLELLAGEEAIRQTLEGVGPAEIMQRIGRPEEHPEGRFLADTYHFPRGTTDLAFLKRAYQAQADLLASEWQRRDPELPLDDPYEALILASIIEKETGGASERARIAGVFVRRLRKGMKLQTDPTVIYGMGRRYNGNIRKRDLLEDAPYNTYVHRGLPPTPIALPGADAIHAALHPSDGKALYFVAKGNGEHHFSATLEEHNRAVRKYQLRR